MSKRIISPYAPALLSALQCQGNTNNCGPFTTATVLNGLHKKSLNGAVLADEMNRVRWDGVVPVVRRVPNSATFPWGMVDIFRRYNMDATWSLFTRVDDLIKLLEHGDILMPMIGQWRPPTGHVMTLIAWDDEVGFGFANTQYESKEIYWLKSEEFIKKWKNMGNLLVRIRQVR